MIDFARIRTYPISQRENKFQLTQMISAASAISGPAPLLPPDESKKIADLGQIIAKAHAQMTPVVLQMGAAVVKEGCSDLIIDLLKNGVISHIAGNGAVSIHDFEIALIGATSEHVPDGLKEGTFGMAEETGQMMNQAINSGAAKGEGLGSSIGRMIDELDLPFKKHSLAWNCFKLDIPFTIHVSLGCDIIHQHPACDGAATGAATFTDFKIFTRTIASLHSGVLLNYGSAVSMPEVFLKALTIARNLGFDAAAFTTANFDFFDMYRPRTRVLEWPAALGCTGFDIRGGHRQTMPALYRAIKHLQIVPRT